MKVIKPFFLGVLGGLGLSLALLVGLFFTPLRQAFYFELDPELAAIRSKLDRYQEWLAQTDLRIAENQNDRIGEGGVSDSLGAAQTKAWRDYKGWRTRLGELARAHERPTAEGFWPWTYSLRFWILPCAAGLTLLPGLLMAWRARSRFRPDRAKPRDPSARAQALSNFEDAIKKVARLSESERGNATPPLAPLSPDPVFPSRSLALPGKPFEQEPPTDYLQPPTDPIPASTYTEMPKPAPLAKAPKQKAPEAAAQPIRPEVIAPQADNGRDTRFLQVGPGWGESLNPPGERIGNPGANRPAPLSMEDEDVADARLAAARTGKAETPDTAGEGEETLGIMPPTTEVERVERRKDEVLKLARKGMTSSEISRRMRLSQDQVEFIIRLRREKG